jgi:hypothetical protein
MPDGANAYPAYTLVNLMPDTLFTPRSGIFSPYF